MVFKILQFFVLSQKQKVKEMKRRAKNIVKYDKQKKKE